MPTYVYQCDDCCRQFERSHPVEQCDDDHPCPRCHARMHRVPQTFRVNWNGLPPHLETMQDSPARADLLNPRHQAERRESYAATKAARGESYG